LTAGFFATTFAAFLAGFLTSGFLASTFFSFEAALTFLTGAGASTFY